ncbi:MAG: hypothetical protein WDN07_04345 [Actinomycetota bacterium]
MIILKLLIVLALFVLFIFLSIRLIRRGLSKRYEPRAKTPWNSLNEGEDPSV